LSESFNVKLIFTIFRLRKVKQENGHQNDSNHSEKKREYYLPQSKSRAFRSKSLFQLLFDPPFWQRNQLTAIS